jgi:hypothetical protein
MSVNIKLIRTKTFLQTTVTEVLNFAVSKQALLDIAAQIEQPGQCEIRVDSREADTVLSMVNIDQLDRMLAAHPSLRESKIALVKDPKQAGFLETIPANSAVHEQAITGSEEALTWLGNARAVVATITLK